MEGFNINEGSTGQVLIPGALHSTADENVVVYTGDVYDDNLNKNQRSINDQLLAQVTSNTAKINAIANITTGIFSFKGAIDSVSDLPKTATIGDAYFVKPTAEENLGTIYVCTKASSPTSYTFYTDMEVDIDLSEYMTTGEKIYNEHVGTFNPVLKAGGEYYAWQEEENTSMWLGYERNSISMDDEASLERSQSLVKSQKTGGDAIYSNLGHFTDITEFYKIVEELQIGYNTLKTDYNTWHTLLNTDITETLNQYNDANSKWRDDATEAFNTWLESLQGELEEYQTTLNASFNEVSNKVNTYTFDVYAQANLNVYNANSNSRLIENKVNAIVDCLAEILPLLAYNTSEGYELSEQLINELKLIDLLTIEDTKFPVRPVYSENTSIVDVAICDVAVCDII